MSTAFTIDANNYMEQDKREELRLALSERYAFVRNQPVDLFYQKYLANFTDPNYEYAWEVGAGTSADTLDNNEPAHGKGFNLQDYWFFNFQQYMIENLLIHSYGFPNATYYDSANPLPIDTDIETTDPYSYLYKYGLDISFNSFLEFCKHCGGTLYTSDTDYGVRRCDTLDSGGNAIFERGQLQVGDYLGGWLAEDLVLAYENLTTCAKQLMPISYEDDDNYFEYNLFNSSVNVKNTTIGSYEAASTVAVSFPQIPIATPIANRALAINGDPYNGTAGRDYETVIVQNLDTTVTTNIKVTINEEVSPATYHTYDVEVDNGTTVTTPITGATYVDVSADAPTITALPTDTTDSATDTDIDISSDSGSDSVSYNVGICNLNTSSDLLNKTLLQTSLFKNDDLDLSIFYDQPYASNSGAVDDFYESNQFFFIFDLAIHSAPVTYSLGEIFAQRVSDGTPTEPINFSSDIASWANITANDWYSRALISTETVINHGFYKAYLSASEYLETVFCAYTLNADFTNA